MKTCFKCGRALPLGEFYRHSMMADGYLGKCKECTRADVRANRKAHADYYRSYDKKRYEENPKRWQRGHPPKYRQRYDLAWKLRHPEKRRAHVILGSAVRRGLLTRQPCEICGGRAEAHHDDYSKPLDVRWLCKPHHFEHHKLLRRAS